MGEAAPSESKYHIYIFQGFTSSSGKALSDGHEKRGKWEIYISRMKRFRPKDLPRASPLNFSKALRDVNGIPLLLLASEMISGRLFVFVFLL